MHAPANLGLPGRTGRRRATALAAAPAFRPHVVLIELALPGMDGYETARRLGELPQPARLVAVTTCRDEDRRRTRREGFVAHVVKPAEPAELRALLGRLAGLFRLERAAAAASAAAIARHRRTRTSGAIGMNPSPEDIDDALDDGALNLAASGA